MDLPFPLALSCIPPMPEGHCGMHGEGDWKPAAWIQKPRIHPRQQIGGPRRPHSPDPKPRIGANYSFAGDVDGWPSCSSRLKMHSTSDRRALRYARRKGREGQLKTLGVPVPLALRCIPQVTEGHCGMHGERGWEVKTSLPPKHIDGLRRTRRPQPRSQTLDRGKSRRPVAPTQKPRVGPR